MTSKTNLLEAPLRPFSYDGKSEALIHSQPHPTTSYVGQASSATAFTSFGSDSHQHPHAYSEKHDPNAPPPYSVAPVILNRLAPNRVAPFLSSVCLSIVHRSRRVKFQVLMDVHALCFPDDPSCRARLSTPHTYVTLSLLQCWHFLLFFYCLFGKRSTIRILAFCVVM